MARMFSKQPSPYPSPVFHGIRAGQVVSSIIVTSVLGFFIHHLSIELYYVPWTFILLLTVSVLTLASFIATSVFYHQRTLKPRTNAFVNGFLSVLWMLGFALLAWNLSGLLSHKCTIENWSSELGVMVCRIYKALMSFTVIGMLTTLAALILDIHTHRATSHLGAYGSMHDPHHDSKNLLHPAPNFSDNPNTPSYREPDLEFPDFSHETKQPYRVQKPIEAGQFGYAAPTEQTSYAGALDMGDLGLMQGRGYASGGVV
ncbi:hypothetical protein MMC17_003199 [Xylographa soralifera]|nr:hypothetical protein [Xylographa soralifera]